MTAPQPNLATVAGIEFFAIMRQADFSYAESASGFEVLFSINGKPRRMALCVHETDAKAIAAALRLAHKIGVV